MSKSKPLTALAVTRLSKPGRYAVGDGLYLQIGPPARNRGSCATCATAGPGRWVWGLMGSYLSRTPGDGLWRLVAFSLIASIPSRRAGPTVRTPLLRSPRA